MLSTGRCGSLTLANAFRAADNYTSGHETLIHKHPAERFDYPDDHIEVDNRLSWFLGELDRRFGDEAHYVHLTRDPEAVAVSYAKRWPKLELGHDPGIMGAYAHGVFNTGRWPEVDRLDLARSYVSTVTANIDLFLRNRPHVSRADVATLPADVERIWDEIGATGDLRRAIALASSHDNPSRPEPSAPVRAKAAVRKLAGQVRWAVTTQPSRRSDA